MACTVTLRRSGGSIILSIPKNVAKALSVEEGSVVQLSVNGQSLTISPARLSLADRLAKSPKTPSGWRRDTEWAEDRPVGRETL